MILKGLAGVDDISWPINIPKTVDHPDWEFCFAGEPIFVVCTTPFHIKRLSRHSLYFSLLFQPRWVFANILNTEQKAEKAFRSVRQLLSQYDDATISPFLGMYGKAENREHLQYFLADNQEPLGCPFNYLGEQND